MSARRKAMQDDARSPRNGRFYFPARAIAALFFALIAGPAIAAPPTDDNGYFVDGGACPFECCTYGPWRAARGVALYDAPRGERVVGVVRKGDAADGRTGIVYTRPQRVQVHKPSPDGVWQPGDVFYILTYLGEGFAKVWSTGTVTEYDIYGTGLDASDACFAEDDGCWWSMPGEHRRYDMQWWARVDGPGGKSGWTDRAGYFSGIDRCG